MWPKGEPVHVTPRSSSDSLSIPECEKPPATDNESRASGDDSKSKSSVADLPPGLPMPHTATAVGKPDGGSHSAATLSVRPATSGPAVTIAPDTPDFNKSAPVAYSRRY